MNVVVKDFPNQEWLDFKSDAVRKNLTLREALREAVKDWRLKNGAAL